MNKVHKRSGINPPGLAGTAQQKGMPLASLARAGKMVGYCIAIAMA